MSPNAARIGHLRRQLDELDHWLTLIPRGNEFRAHRRTTQRTRDRVAAVLCGLAGLLISGAY